MTSVKTVTLLALILVISSSALGHSPDKHEDQVSESHLDNSSKNEEGFQALWEGYPSWISLAVIVEVLIAIILLGGALYHFRKNSS